jgi:hypothetical protein
MTTIGEILATASAQTPWLIFVATVLLGLAGLVARRVYAGLRRQGERIGHLEQLRIRDRERAQLERVRRYQLEVALDRAGIDLAPWPDSPADDDDPDDDLRTTQLATQDFSRHHLTGRAPTPYRRTP